MAADSSSPGPRSNGGVTFVVDDSPKGRRIASALCAASNVFAHESTLYDPRPLWELENWTPLFVGVLSEEEQQTVKASLERKELPLDALLKVATPAPFGRDGETVFDPTFRNALEIPRSRLPCGLLKALELNRLAVGDLERAMKPPSKKWSYNLYKIHLYGPGGKFDDHVDTLHESNHVATVVLSLPSEHVGGILRITHQGETIEFDSAKGPAQSEFGIRKFQYAAFFTDCIHSVQDVISGWRVVVQYDVYEDDGSAGTSNNEEEEVHAENQDDSDEFERVTAERVTGCLENRKSVGATNIHDKEQTVLVQSLLEYKAKKPPTDGVAFFLRHRYSLPALSEAVLKGADRIIYDALSKRDDLLVSLQGVIVYIETVDMECVSVKATAVSMKDFLPGDDAAGSSRKRKGVPSEECTVHLIVDSRNGAMCVHELGETGNEPADGYTSYSVACMVIKTV